MCSQKKAQANRTNSKNSTGPVSSMGKERTRLNALRDGFHAKQVVIEAAGETQLEFDTLRTHIWEYLQPQNPITAMLVEDLAVTHWRLQRPRRGETTEIRRQCETAWWRRELAKNNEVETLKTKFLHDFGAQCLQLEFTDHDALVLSLEDTRKMLEQTSLGFEFLIELTQRIGKQVRQHGYVLPMNEKLLVAVCGINDKAAKTCLLLNQIAKAELQKFTNDASTDRTSFECNRDIISMRLETKEQDMRLKKQITEKLEAAEENSFLASLILLPAERSEKIHRAEAALERRYFKTLRFLLALRGVKIT